MTPVNEFFIPEGDSPKDPDASKDTVASDSQASLMGPGVGQTALGNIAQPSPYPTGAQYELVFGDQRAVVTEVGAAVRLYQVGGRDVIVPFGAHEMSPAAHAAVLMPWPNRIEDGRYSFDGVDYQLALSEPERHNANHGLALYARWELVSMPPGAVTLRLELVPQQGYPFSLTCDITYSLGVDGLQVVAHTTNTGDVDAPYGIGFHPWLSPGAYTIDECVLQVPARGWVRTNERLIPVEETGEIPAELDFRQPRVLGATVLDDAFVDPVGTDQNAVDHNGRDADGRSWAHFTDPSGVRVSCWMAEGLECWQLCTGDGMPGNPRGGLAVEPLSCTANAFRTGQRLVRLKPGQTHTARWGLSLTHTLS
ncbi:MAG: aldose 1-epimerase family protein [Actinomycetaceae bacterium]|nr:aldose 1-epimerase family protein [Actinomycetaceae bacterium]